MATLCMLSLAVLVRLLSFAAASEKPPPPDPTTYVCWVNFPVGVSQVRDSPDQPPFYRLTFTGGPPSLESDPGYPIPTADKVEILRSILQAASGSAASGSATSVDLPSHLDPRQTYKE